MSVLSRGMFGRGGWTPVLVLREHVSMSVTPTASLGCREESRVVCKCGRVSVCLLPVCMCVWGGGVLSEQGPLS